MKTITTAITVLPAGEDILSEMAIMVRPVARSARGVERAGYS